VLFFCVFDLRRPAEVFFCPFPSDLQYGSHTDASFCPRAGAIEKTTELSEKEAKK